MIYVLTGTRGSGAANKKAVYLRRCAIESAYCSGVIDSHSSLNGLASFWQHSSESTSYARGNRRAGGWDTHSNTDLQAS